jgi:hypothetical protein
MLPLFMPLPVEFIPFGFIPFWFDFIPLPLEFIPLLLIPLPDSMLPVPEVPPEVPLPAPSAAQAVVANPIAKANVIAVIPGRFILNSPCCGERGPRSMWQQRIAVIVPAAKKWQ